MEQNEQQQAMQRAADGFWADSMLSLESRLGWWRDARFGMFIHWGVYSQAGGCWKDHPPVGYGEHLMRACTIPKEEYVEELVKPFTASAFDADAWAEAALQAGMKYMVVTAKHHDGFAMYPSQAYPYDIRMTNCGFDPMALLKEACSKRGIKFGFYYSHAFDWEHPDAPGNDWEYDNPGGDKNLYANPGELWFTSHPERIAKAARYVDEKAIPQILELIETYHPDLLWFDTPHKLPISENLRILQAIREADPTILVNSRIINAPDKMFRHFADYLNTADRPAEIFPTDGDWEAIPTTNESYGYSCFDHSHKPASHFIQLLAKIAARGGNMLMNIGPKGDGSFDAPDTAILQKIGAWMHWGGESIYGTRRTPLSPQAWGETTLRGNHLYCHVFQLPSDGRLILGGLGNAVKQAVLLSTGETLPYKRLNSYDHEILLPKQGLDPADTVVRLTFDGEICAKNGFLVLPSYHMKLRSFDAEISAGLGYGDGKRGNDYLWNWSDEAQYAAWKLRLPQAMKAQITVRYLALRSEGVTETSNMRGCHDAGGRYLLFAGHDKIVRNVQMSRDAKTPTEDTFTVTLPSGETTLQLRAAQVDGRELFKLYGVTLKPQSAHMPDGSTLEFDLTDTGD